MKTLSIGIAFMALVTFAALQLDASAENHKYFDGNGVRIAYRGFGTDAQTSPLILLNGGPGRSSDSFAKLAQSLYEKTGRTIITFDQRGTGKSGLPKLDGSTVTLELMLDDLEAFRIHLGLKKLSLLGHSFGGLYAMAYVARYPDKVENLILSCSAGVDLSWREYVTHNMLSRLTQKAREEHAFWTSPEQQEKDPIKASLEALRVLIPAYIYNQKFVPALEKDLLDLKQYTPEINGLVWRSMENFDVSKSLAGFQGRALIIDGRQDFLGEAIPIAIQKAIPGSRLEFLDRCSHYPWLDRPEGYFKLIREFLN